MKIILTSLLLMFSFTITAQVIISPYIVYIDSKDRFGSYIVQNESNEEYEISISFVFGYPVSDSLGQGSMKYFEENPDTTDSIVNWVKAFPRRFILPPKQKQIIRMTARPPDTLQPGTYWSRIVTSAVPKAAEVGTDTTGIRARVNFVLNQVTTVLYRLHPAEAGVELENFVLIKDSSMISALASVKRTGNSPFYGDVTLKILDSENVLVDQREEFVSLFYSLVKRIELPTNSLSAGKYYAELTIEHNEKEDIPESDLKVFPTITETIEFEVP